MDDEGNICSKELQTGGKGVNLMRVFCSLGGKGDAMVALSPDGAQLFCDLAANEKIPLLSVFCAQTTRTVITRVSKQTLIQDVQADTAQGFDAAAFLAAYEQALPHYDLVALCGSLPPHCPPDLYAQMIQSSHRYGTPVYLDTYGLALEKAIGHHPDYIKPNAQEISGLLGYFVSAQNVRHAARDAQALGARHVLITLGQDGALLCGDEEIFLPALRVKTVNAVGSGDSFSGAFLYALSRNAPWRACLELAMAAGAANARMFPAARISRKDLA